MCLDGPGPAMDGLGRPWAGLSIGLPGHRLVCPWSGLATIWLAVGWASHGLGCTRRRLSIV
jgi:hypothetical protein